MNKLKLARLKAELPQWKVALAAGMTQSSYWQIEAALRKPSDSEKKWNAEALGLEIEQIFTTKKKIEKEKT